MKPTDNQPEENKSAPNPNEDKGKPVYKKPVILRYHQIDQVNAYSLRKPYKPT